MDELVILNEKGKERIILLDHRRVCAISLLMGDGAYAAMQWTIDDAQRIAEWLTKWLEVQP